VIPPVEELNWYRFLARPRLPSPPPEVFDALYRQPILITGAGGMVGSALALRLAVLTPPKLLLMEAAESSLYKLKQEWAEARVAGVMTPILGNTANLPLVEHIFEAHAPRIVFHSAAFKYVSLLEEHPLAAIANNIFATETLARAAAAHGARVVLLSTDKVVAPTSVMGATKRVAEQIVLAFGGTVVRLGNVLGARDSVTDIFARQIALGGPVTVTDPAARRFFLTLDETVNTLLAAAAFEEPSTLLAPTLPAPHYIADLAHFMAQELAPGREIAIDFTQLRSGEKDSERMWTAGQAAQFIKLQNWDAPLVAVQAPLLTAEQLGVGLAHLRAALDVRNLAGALVSLRQLVPDYTPGQAVLELSRQQGPQASL
jgi:FlaA1/EpsC-like NDP-sugar epimerase